MTAKIWLSQNNAALLLLSLRSTEFLFLLTSPRYVALLCLTYLIYSAIWTAALSLPLVLDIPKFVAQPSQHSMRDCSEEERFYFNLSCWLAYAREQLVNRIFVTGIKNWYLFWISNFMLNCFPFFFTWDSAAVNTENLIWLEFIPKEQVFPERIENLLLEEFHAGNKNVTLNPPALTTPRFEWFPWSRDVQLNTEQFTLPFEFGSPNNKLIDQLGPFVEANYSNPVDALELESKLEELADNQAREARPQAEKEDNLNFKSKFLIFTLKIIGGVCVTFSVCAGVSLYLNPGLAGIVNAVSCAAG